MASGWKLIVIRGADEGKQFELSGPLTTVGREASNSIRLHDTEVSRRHAELIRDGDSFRIRDIGSANGTYLNDQLITEAPLAPGDQIQIGQSILVVSGGRSQGQERQRSLSEQISLIARQDVELSSAIVKTVSETEGSRILARPEQLQRPWLQNALVNLGVLYELTQAVSHILDVGQLLDRVLELTFRSIEADRGCILIKAQGDSVFQPRAVRLRTSPDDPAEKFPVSRTILEYVLKEKQGILVSDAMQDERFASKQSIVRFGVREVICVPMKGRHETIGVLYLDTHSVPRDLIERANPTGKFTEDHLSLAIAIAHQAALAIEETRYHEALVQSERMAAIGQTIAALSHHGKNILQGLQSGGHLVKTALAGTDIDRELLTQGWKIVEKNLGKIQDLFLDMLTYSKEREPAIEEVDLNELVKEVVELMAPRAREKGVRLEMKLGQMPICQVDPDGIHKALLNVIVNAIDACEEKKDGGVIVGTSIEAVQDPQGEQKEWAQMIVRDHGVGIPAERLGDLFKPFVSTKGARGTGLGLAVSRKIIREHGGDILVQSQPGKGSRFVLRVPVKNPLAEAAFESTTKPHLPVLEE